MPKNNYHEDWGIGEWSGNNPQADIDPDTQTEIGPRFPIYRNSSDFNLNKVLIGNVQRNNYFKQLTKYTTFKQVVDQIYYQVEFITPWEPGTHSNKSAGGMCSQVRGVATAGRATKCWMWLVKLMRLQPTHKQIQILIQHPDSPFLRGIGFLFLRYCCDPKQLWGWFQNYLKDPEEIQIRKFDKRKATLGQFLCEILINVEYESTHFPRIPIPLHKRMLAEIESMGLKGLSGDAPDDDRDDRHAGRYRDSRQRGSDRGRPDARDSGRRDSRGSGRRDSSRGHGGKADTDRSAADKDRSRSRSRGRRRKRSGSRGRDRRRDRDRDRRDRDRDRRDRDRDRDRDRGKRHRERDRGSHGKRSSKDRSADADRKADRSSPTYE